MGSKTKLNSIDFHCMDQNMITVHSASVFSYLIDDKSACHAQTCLGPKVVGDHDPEAGLWEPIMWRA